MNSQVQKVMFSSKNSEWTTPQDLYNALDEEYGFTLDPCATHESAKCKKYYTPEDDGLNKDWTGQTVFMNPPYGREIKHWLKKAWLSSRKGNTTVVCLIPARTDTKYWHEYCMKAHRIIFIKGRLKFGNQTNSAPFPSAIVIFKMGFRAIFSGGNYPKIYTMSTKGDVGRGY